MATLHGLIIENRQLRAQIDRLKEELSNLRREMRPPPDTPRVVLGIHLSPSQARILQALYAGPKTKLQLCRIGMIGEDSLSPVICRLRQQLRGTGVRILVQYSTCYYLARNSLEQLREVYDPSSGI